MKIPAIFDTSDRARTAWKTTATVCRLVMAVTFIFSGFVKSVDPWGTALKISEYMDSFGIQQSDLYRFGFAIWLCAAELMMGCMLLFKVRLRLITLFALCTMTIFTAVTFILAVWEPVSDCGCFGDAVKLTNWQTFFKNLILWPMSMVIFYAALDGRFFPLTRREVILTLLFMTMSGGLGAYCYRHLPLIDFLPYKKGVNLREAMMTESGETSTTLIYRDLTDGSLREFSLEDTTWYDESRWEYVSTQVESTAVTAAPTLREFALFDAEGDATEEILSYTGRTWMLCVSKLELLDDRCRRNMRRGTEQARSEGARIICVTSTPLSETTWLEFDGSEPVRCYNIDATTFVTMLRAKAGAVILEDGVIVKKLNCRDIK